MEVELSVVDFRAPFVFGLESIDTSTGVRVEEALPDSAADQTEALSRSQAGQVVLEVGRRTDASLEHKSFQVYH